MLVVSARVQSTNKMVAQTTILVQKTFMSPLQCRLGRTALGWSAQQLADAAAVSVNTVTKFERGGDARLSTVAAIKQALEYVGVELVSEGQDSTSGGEGVRFTPAGTPVLERMINERDELIMQMETSRASSAEEPQSTVGTPGRMIRSARKSNFLRHLEDRIDGLQRRIDRMS